jgi:hypothetical protein
MCLIIWYRNENPRAGTLVFVSRKSVFEGGNNKPSKFGNVIVLYTLIGYSREACLWPWKKLELVQLTENNSE